MADDLVVLDANVLIPSASRDTLLRAAEIGLFRPRWSVEILNEVERNLVEHGMATQAGAQRLIAAFNATFPGATVQGYAGIIETLTNAPKDRHVLAAAIRAHATIIVTDNLRDFQQTALQPYGIQALSSDEFLGSLLHREPAIMTRIVQRQAAELRYPPVTINETLNAIALTAPGFADLMRQRIA